MTHLQGPVSAISVSAAPLVRQAETQVPLQVTVWNLNISKCVESVTVIPPPPTPPPPHNSAHMRRAARSSRGRRRSADAVVARRLSAETKTEGLDLSPLGACDVKTLDWMVKNEINCSD